MARVAQLAGVALAAGLGALRHAADAKTGRASTWPASVQRHPPRSEPGGLLDAAVRVAYIASGTRNGAAVADIGQNVLDAIADFRAAVERRFTAVDERFGSVDGRLSSVQQRLDAVDERLAVLAPMRAQLDSLPMINRTVTVVQQEVRAVRAAFNDFALTNPTVGEIEALHQDVNRVQAENAELAVKVTTPERLVRELQER
jgi:hypothetical protein